MLYADDAGVISQSPDQLRKMIGVIVIVTVCAAFRLNVSKAKTEIMCLSKGDAGVHRHIQRRDNPPGVQPHERVRIFRRGTSTTMPTCPSRSTGHMQRMVQLPEVHPRTVRPTERSPRAQNPDAKSRSTRDNAVRLPHVEPARVPLRYAAPNSPQLSDSLHQLAKEQSH